MTTGDPYLMVLALISLLLWVQAVQDGCRWQWGYAGCFAVAFTAAFINQMW